jgi:hypothetical protein
VVCRIFQKSVGGKKLPMECNADNVNHRSSTTFNIDTRSSLPALLESPNVNNSVDDSDCLLDNSFHSGVHDSMRSNNSWGSMKTEVVAALDSLHQGKSELLRCDSYLIDLYAAAAEIGATTSTPGKIDNGGYTKLLRQDSNNFNLQPAPLVSLKYLDPQSTSRGMKNSHLRVCKSEPYASEEDEAQRSVGQRSSLMDSWMVTNSSGGFSNEPVLPSMTNESSVTDLDNNNDRNPYFRHNRSVGSSAFITDPSSTAGSELAECLWAY